MRIISKYAPLRGAYIRRSNVTQVFYVTRLGGGGGGHIFGLYMEGSFLEFYGDISLFTDPLFSLQSPSNGGDKIYTAWDLLTASLASLPVFSKRKIKQRLCTGYGDMC